MTDRQTISVQEVRGLALAIFDRISASGIELVEIDQPTYWSVFPADVFSIEKPDLVLSDIEDDLTDLRSEASDSDAPVSLGSPWHALHHLAGICSALAAGTMEPSFVAGQREGGDIS
jgi:hypothetical protein